MDVTLDIMIAMPTLHAQTLTAATSVHATEPLRETVSTAQVSDKSATSFFAQPWPMKSIWETCC